MFLVCYFFFFAFHEFFETFNSLLLIKGLLSFFYFWNNFINLNIFVCHKLFFVNPLSFFQKSRIPFINTLIVNCEYSLSNRENLQLPIQMELSETPKIFCCIFIAFLESILNSEHFEKENQSLLKLLTPKDVLT